MFGLKNNFLHSIKAKLIAAASPFVIATSAFGASNDADASNSFDLDIAETQSIMMAVEAYHGTTPEREMNVSPGFADGKIGKWTRNAAQNFAIQYGGADRSFDGVRAQIEDMLANDPDFAANVKDGFKILGNSEGSSEKTAYSVAGNLIDQLGNSAAIADAEEIVEEVEVAAAPEAPAVTDEAPAVEVAQAQAQAPVSEAETPTVAAPTVDWSEVAVAASSQPEAGNANPWERYFDPKNDSMFGGVALADEVVDISDATAAISQAFDELAAQRKAAAQQRAQDTIDSVAQFAGDAADILAKARAAFGDVAQDAVTFAVNKLPQVQQDSYGNWYTFEGDAEQAAHDREIAIAPMLLPELGSLPDYGTATPVTWNEANIDEILAELGVDNPDNVEINGDRVKVKVSGNAGDMMRNLRVAAIAGVGEDGKTTVTTEPHPTTFGLPNNGDAAAAAYSFFGSSSAKGGNVRVPVGVGSAKGGMVEAPYRATPVYDNNRGGDENSFIVAGGYSGYMDPTGVAGHGYAYGSASWVRNSGNWHSTLGIGGDNVGGGDFSIGLADSNLTYKGDDGGFGGIFFDRFGDMPNSALHYTTSLNSTGFMGGSVSPLTPLTTLNSNIIGLNGGKVWDHNNGHTTILNLEVFKSIDAGDNAVLTNAGGSTDFWGLGANLAHEINCGSYETRFELGGRHIFHSGNVGSYSVSNSVTQMMPWQFGDQMPPGGYDSIVQTGINPVTGEFEFGYPVTTTTTQNFNKHAQNETIIYAGMTHRRDLNARTDWTSSLYGGYRWNAHGIGANDGAFATAKTGLEYSLTDKFKLQTALGFGTNGVYGRTMTYATGEVGVTYDVTENGKIGVGYQRVQGLNKNTPDQDFFGATLRFEF